MGSNFYGFEIWMEKCLVCTYPKVWVGLQTFSYQVGKKWIAVLPVFLIERNPLSALNRFVANSHLMEDYTVRPNVNLRTNPSFVSNLWGPIRSCSNFSLHVTYFLFSSRFFLVNQQTQAKIANFCLGVFTFTVVIMADQNVGDLDVLMYYASLMEIGYC